jgi:hypothetical protein
VAQKGTVKEEGLCGLNPTAADRAQTAVRSWLSMELRALLSDTGRRGAEPPPRDFDSSASSDPRAELDTHNPRFSVSSPPNAKGSLERNVEWGPILRGPSDGMGIDDARHETLREPGLRRSDTLTHAPGSRADAHPSARARARPDLVRENDFRSGPHYYLTSAAVSAAVSQEGVDAGFNLEGEAHGEAAACSAARVQETSETVLGVAAVERERE